MLPPLAASTTKFAALPGLTVNVFDVPFFPLAMFVALIVVFDCTDVMATGCEVSTPAVKFAVVIGEAVSVALEVNCTFEVNDGTVLLKTSCAVTRMLKGAPAICGPMLPPAAASARK